MSMSLYLILSAPVKAKPDLNKLKQFLPFKSSSQTTSETDPNLPLVRPFSNQNPNVNSSGVDYDFYTLPAQTIQAQTFEGNDPDYGNPSTDGMTRVEPYRGNDNRIPSFNTPSSSQTTYPSNYGLSNGQTSPTSNLQYPSAQPPTNYPQSNTITGQIPSVGSGHIIAKPYQPKFDQLFNTSPQNAQDYLRRGISRFEFQDYTGAIGDLDQAINLEPNLGEAYFYRGSAYRQLKNNRAAEKDLEKALSLNGDSANYYLKSGMGKEQAQDYSGAIDDFNHVLGLDNTNLRAYFARANTKLKAGQYASALTDYNEVLRLDPVNAEALRQRAYTKYKLGRSQEAMADYEASKNLFFEQKNLIGYQSAVRSINLLRNSSR
ncbi:MAG: tetratricopeptide repeat protein [Candidatus Caenarcaniphilales bacterium]|nr:tetratricopeptide repeat protein [Candidatus Caenarcaniphilales bacterium]